MARENHEIAQAFERVKQSEQVDENAAEIVWGEFHDPLLRVAKNQLRQDNKRVADEEDIVQSVMRQFFEGASNDDLLSMRIGAIFDACLYR